MNYLHAIFIANNAKLWTNIAYAVATYKIAVTPLEDISSEVFLLWITIVASVELLKRAIAAKLGATSEEPQPGQPPTTRIETTTLRKKLQVQPAAAEAATDVEPPSKPKPRKGRK